MDGNVKTLLKKFCLEGPFAGLKYFYIYPDKISRCFWALNMIAVSYAACLLTFLLHRRFSEMPTRITIENQNEPIDTFPYPAITICSPNQIAISSIDHLKKTFVDGNVSANFDSLFPKLLSYYEYVNEINEDELDIFQEAIELNRYSIPELLGAVTQKCDNFLKRCLFYHEIVDCNEIFKPILTTHGMCCVFNSWYSFKKMNERDHNYVPLTPKNMDGLIGALSVVTDYEPMDAVDRTLLNAGSMRVQETKIILSRYKLVSIVGEIMFTDWKEFPADDESCLQHSSVEVYNIIEGTFTYCSEEVKSLASWTRKCFFEDEMKLRYFNKYRNNDCDHLCFVQAVEKHCGCLMPYLPYLHAARACNLTKLKCIRAVKIEITDSESSVCSCPRDCESRSYKVDTSVGNLLGLPYMITNPYSDIKFNKSTTLMHFFFRSSVYTKKKQETVMSIISFVSNLGGVFGLCLGCSLFSLYEIIFYVYCSVKNKIKNKLQLVILK